jgi:hypothetical protein
LKLPGPSRFTALIFNDRFYEFLRRIERNANETATYAVTTDEADVRIGYDPNQKFASGGHTSYTVVYSLNENSLYSALIEKAKQLRGTGFDGPLGIFVCDGGCDFVKNTMSRGLSYDAKDVIHQFLSEEIGEELPVRFVVKIAVLYTGPTRSSPFLDFEVFTAAARDEKEMQILAIIQNLIRHLPSPESDATNALNWLKVRNSEGRSFWGGFAMSEKK